MAHSDDLSGLVALMNVASTRSFTAAGAQMRVSPSAVSQAIRTLEERVGVRLVQRTTRSVGLTEAGARFIARLKPALEGVHEAFESLNELRDRPAGLLRLSVPRLAHNRIIAPKLKKFLAAYPDIQLDISIDDAFVDIVDRGFDAGIRIGEMLDREMVRVPLGKDLRVAIVAAPSYWARHPKPKHPRDLVHHDCINYRRRALGTVWRWEFTENGKDFDVAVNGRVLLNDGELMVDAALDGLGLGYLMDMSVREHLASKRLIRVLEPYCVPFPGFFLYYPTRRNIAPKLQAFVDFFRFTK